MNIVRRLLAVPVALGLFAVACAASTPKLDVVYPPDEKYESTTRRMPVTGQADCTDCSLTVGDKSVPVNPDGTFYTEVTLQPGRQIIPVRLTDQLGNTIRKDFEVINVLPAPKNDSPTLLPMIPQGPPPTIMPPPIAEPIREPSGISHKSSIIKYNKVLNSINIYRNGKLVATIDASGFFFKENRVFIPSNSDFWNKFNITNDSKSNKMIFRLEDPIQDISISLDQDIDKPAPITINGQKFIPIRASFEIAGYLVQWEAGKIHITGPPCRPANTMVSLDDSREVQLKGVNLFGTLFVRHADLKSIGLKVKNPDKNQFEISNSSGNWVKIRILSDKIDITNDKGDIFTVDSSRTKRISLKENYDIPLRNLLASFGYGIKWDSENHNAKAFIGTSQKLASKTR